MDVRCILPFLKAVQNVFETMINIPYTLAKPSIKTDFNSSHSVGIGLHNIAFAEGVPTIFIPCRTDKGPFSIDVAIKVG